MPARKFTQIAMLTSLGIALHIIEVYIPNPLIVFAPGAKLGLANIIALVTLVLFGLKYGLLVNILRCIIGGLVVGSVMSMMYSISGAIVSTFVMWVAYKYLNNYFSLIGVSLLGAIGHNVAQLFVASLLVSNIRIFIYLPIMMLVSIFTGSFIGLAAIYVLERLNTAIQR
ncbi:MAG: Gx transporter family protein [Alkaliphilus sp.]